MKKKEVKKCCNDCKYFGYESGGSIDFPYPEFWCIKKHWDGITHTDQLLIEIDCKDFKTIDKD